MNLINESLDRIMNEINEKAFQCLYAYCIENFINENM